MIGERGEQHHLGGHGFNPLLPSWHKKPKLTGQQRDEIRRRYAEGETAPALAAEFGVATSTIYANCPRR